MELIREEALQAALQLISCLRAASQEKGQLPSNKPVLLAFIYKILIARESMLDDDDVTTDDLTINPRPQLRKVAIANAIHKCHNPEVVRVLESQSESRIIWK